MAGYPNSTPITAPITPLDTQDGYPTTWAEFILGGFESVANIAERDAISPQRRTGKLVRVADSDGAGNPNYYIYLSGWQEEALLNVAGSPDAQIAANQAAIARLKAIVDAQPEEVYTYAGNDVPTIPDKAFKGYFITLFALKSGTEYITIPKPTAGLPDGTTLLIDNNDINQPVWLRPAAGETIDGAGTTVKIPLNNLIFLVKHGTNWVSAFKGYVPTSLTRLITDIKANLPSGGSALSLQDIENQLKDQLHTFRDIQTQLAPYLHTTQQLQEYGFVNHSIHFGLLDSINTQPTDSSGWISGRMVVDRPLYLPVSTGNKYIGFVVPLSLDSLVSELRIDDHVVTATKSVYIRQGLQYKLYLTPTTYDMTQAHTVEFRLSDTSHDGNVETDETFKYLSGGAAQTIPTDKDNVYIDYIPTGDLTQTLPSVFAFRKAGTRLVLRNMSDTIPVTLQASNYQSIEGLSTWEIPPRSNVILLVDKTTRQFRHLFIGNDELRNDYLAWVYWGWSSDPNTPADDSWIEGTFSANKKTATRATELGQQYLRALVPKEMGGLVKGFGIDNAFVEVIKSDYEYATYDFTMLRSSEKVDLTKAHEFKISWGIEQGPQSGTTGIEIDDSTTDVTNVKKLSVSGMYLANSDPDDLQLKAVTSFETLDGMSGGRVNRVLVEDPLECYLDPTTNPGEEDRVKLYVKHDYFEKFKTPCYYACLTENEEIVGRGKANAPGIKQGHIWFDNVIVNGSNGYIPFDRAQKTIGLQDYTGDDPNVTGGVPFLIAYRVAMKGAAPEDGYVELLVRNKDEGTVIQNGEIVTDANGNPIGVRRNYKAGETLGVLDAIAIYMAKGLVSMELLLEHNFASDAITIEDRTEGVSGICVQGLSADYQTGPALLQFENDTHQSIKFTRHYNGEDIFNVQYYLQHDIAEDSINPGDGQTTIDGFHFYNNTGMKAQVANKIMTLQDNGSDLCYFSFGQIFDAEKTLMLRGKNLSVAWTMENKHNAFDAYMASWKGTPNKYTKKIVDHYDADQGPITETNWTLISNPISGSEDAVSGQHKVSGTLTVPADANNFAVILVPRTAQLPCSLKLSTFEVNVADPFYGYVVEAPEQAHEKHLEYSKTYRKLIADSKGYASVRYTVNNVSTGMPMPVGILDKGAADVTVDHTVNQVSGSSLPQFEGAIKFTNAANVVVSTELYLWSEKAHSVVAQTTFWWAKVSDDGNSFTKIPTSEYTVGVRGQTKALNRMPNFLVSVNAGERIALFATSDQADGCYMQTKAGDKNPMLKVELNIDEITEQEQDLLEQLSLLDAEIEITKEAKDAGVYIKVDYDVDKKQPIVEAAIK